MLSEKGCYCQGMNFVGAFILKISEDEEESFYLIMGLFKPMDIILFGTGILITLIMLN